MEVWANKRMDASFADWRFAVRSCLVGSADDPAPRIESGWDPSGGAVVGLSVRSLFDLWLSTQAWEPGDRIIFSGFTVSDMPRVAREHGLEVAAVDIDPMTAEPDVAMLDELIDERTRAFVYTHLFGSRGNVTDALKLAHDRGLMFVEDCAEAYAGPSWTGNSAADITLFSFGPIKNATAFGGGIARLADPVVAQNMRSLGSTQPVQTRVDYLNRVLKYGSLGLATTPLLFGRIVRLLALVGSSHDAALNRLSRGFPGSKFFTSIRRRPSRALLLVLERRLGQGDDPLARRSALGQALVRALDGVEIPTADAEEHTYWLVPALIADPNALIGRLDDHGFHATAGRAFDVVESDASVDRPEPLGARRLFDSAVFLPFAPEMPAEALDKLASIVNAEAARQRAALSEGSTDRW
jgi:perosamine synthetase